MTSSQPLQREAVISTDGQGERLDRWLARTFPDVSRTRFQALIAEGRVTVEGNTVTEPRYKLTVGLRVIVKLPEPEAPEPLPETMAIDIVYEDDDLIVINKEAGLVVHPGAGHQKGTLVNALLAHCGDSLSGIGGVRRPGIVHRLDKDTSGLLVVAKNDASHKALSAQFAAHGRDGRLERRYLAFVWGVPDRKQGSVSASLARSTTNRKKIAISSAPSARSAVTHYKLLESFGDVASLLECRLETGRTHQIRVHMASIGHPVLGDPVYGKGFLSSLRKLPENAQTSLLALNRQALHAATLGFEHPRTSERLQFTVPLPPDMHGLLITLREPKPSPPRKIDVSKK